LIFLVVAEDLEEILQHHLQYRERCRVDGTACDADLLDKIALSRRHVILKHAEILSRLPLALLAINVDVVVGPSAGHLDWLFQVGNELAEEG